MAGKLVHVEINAADADRAQGFWSGVFGWEVGPPMSPEMDYRMFRTGEDQGGAIVGGQAQGPLTVYFDTDDIDATIAQGARARRRGRGQDAGAGLRLVRRLQGHRRERVQPLAERRVCGVAAGSDSDQTTAGGSSSRSTSCDGSGQPSISFAFVGCSFIRSLNARSTRRGYVPRRSRTRSAFPSLRGIAPGWTISTRAVSPSTLCELLRAPTPASTAPST